VKNTDPPNPLQVNAIGYPGTLGANFIDSIVTDRVTSPPEAISAYTERMVLMPNAYLVNGLKASFPDVVPMYAIPPCIPVPKFKIITSTHLNPTPSAKHQNPNNVPLVTCLSCTCTPLTFERRLFHNYWRPSHESVYHLTRSERGEGEGALEEALEASQDIANLGEEVEPEAGLFHGKVALACFNTLIKITPRVSTSISINFSNVCVCVFLTCVFIWHAYDCV
jgi:hypothetical protein